MTDSFFTTSDGVWFQPTQHARGPWAPDACHAGPPTALLARAAEGVAPHHQLNRLTVELMRPIPMSGFRVQAEIRRPGRSVTLSGAEILDDDHIYARSFALHTRVADDLVVPTVSMTVPQFEEAKSAAFPIVQGSHNEQGFIHAVEGRVSRTADGASVFWMRTLASILPDEEPSPFQRICPLADCGNGISFRGALGEFSFVNTDLTINVHREPVGEWFGSQSTAHWHDSGIGAADAELFDVDGPVGRAVQSLIISELS